MKIDDTLISKLAKLSRLSFNEEERKIIKEDLGKMLDLFQQLNKLDLDGVKSLSYINDHEGKLRKDEIGEELQHSWIEKNAPKTISGGIVVPKIIE